MLSQNLEQSLHRAMTCAADRGAELVTLEHLLYALIDDNDKNHVCCFVKGYYSDVLKCL